MSFISSPSSGGSGMPTTGGTFTGDVLFNALVSLGFGTDLSLRADETLAGPGYLILGGDPDSVAGERGLVSTKPFTIYGNAGEDLLGLWSPSIAFQSNGNLDLNTAENANINLNVAGTGETNFSTESGQMISVRDGYTLFARRIAISSPQIPATSVDTGLSGQLTWDNSYIYVCVSSNNWKRVALAEF